MLTASHLYQYTSCPRWPWNELHGDSTRKRGPSAFLRKLLADGHDHEAAIYETLAPARVPWTGDPAAAAEETIRLLRAGAPLVAQAVLRSADGRTGTVDLLERVPGRSALGDFSYEPIEIKTARSVKPVYKLQLSFYADLLSDVLGAWPEHAHVLLHDGGRATFALSEIRSLYDELMVGLRAVAAGREPPVHISSACADCPWELTCLPHAETTRDVSLTYGLQRRVAHLLRDRGVGTLAALAQLDPLDIARWTNMKLHDARQLVTQAGALDRGVAVWTGASEFDDAPLDLYFDIEGDPEHDVLYLFGVLARAKDGGETYRAFVAEKPEEEARAFLELLDHLEAAPNAPVYHYHHYERSALRHLGDRHGVARPRIDAILARLRDLHRDLSTAVVLPVYSYSL